MDQAYNFFVQGRVQGVGFRAYVQTLGRRYRLSGWVRNNSNGAVEGFVQGQADVIVLFQKDVVKGPPGSAVTEIHWVVAPLRNNLSSFKIIP